MREAYYLFVALIQATEGRLSFLNTKKNNCYLTNRFHFAVRLYSDNVQMTSKRGENKEVRRVA